MNKTIASISAAVVIGGSSLSAFVPAVADLGVTGDLTYATEYVFRGVELADHSFQPSIEASAGDFYVGLFSSLPTANRAADRGFSEIHYYAGFAADLPGVDGLALDVGVTVYHTPRSNPQIRHRSHEGYIGTKFSDIAGLEGLGAAAYYFYDSDRRTHIVEGSVGYSLALDPNGDFSLDVSGVYGNQSGGSIRGNRPNRINENYHYYGASVEIPYRLNEFSSLTVGGHYQTAEKANLGGRGDDNLFWTFSYTAGF